MAFLFTPNFQRDDANGLPLAGAVLNFYLAGTSTKISSYQDSGATTPHPSTGVVADSTGAFPAIFLATVVNYKFILKTAADVTLQTVDQIPPGISNPVISPADVGKYLRVNALGTGVEWVDLSIDTGDIADEAITLAKIDDEAKTDFRMVDPNGPRRPLRYYSGTQIQFAATGGFAMGGFRFNGRMKRDRVPIFPEPTPSDSCRHIIGIGNGTSTQGDLAYETTATVKTWYAFFACADDGDAAAVFKVVPFLRVGSVAGSTITLAASGEADYTITSRAHEFTTDGLVGAEVLVITETLNSRINSWSGRETTVTANTTTTVTVAGIGAMAASDLFLVAPNYDHYVYLGCAYFEDAGAGAAELRNFTDDGVVVKTRGVNLSAGSGWVTGAMTATPPWTRVTPWGHLSPLAMGIIMRSTITLATASLGAVGETYGMDTLHTAQELYENKVTDANATFVNDAIHVPQMFGHGFYLVREGSLAAAATGALMVVGWVEP